MAFFSIGGIVSNSLILVVSGNYNWEQHLLHPIKELFMYGAVSSNLPLWFLFTLFVVCVCNIIISKLKWNYFIISIICMLLAFILEYVGYKYPTILSSSLIGLSFYGLGYKLKDIQFFRIISTISLIVSLTLIICAPSIVDVCTNKLLKGNFFSWYIYSLATIILINNLFRKFEYGFYGFSILGYIGENSICFLVTHWILLDLLIAVFPLFNLNDSCIKFGLIILMYIILLPLLNKFLNKPKLKFLLGK